MLRDAAPQNLDLTVVPDFPVSVLNPDTVRRYRLRMANLRPMHSYHSLEDVEFLYQLGAVRRSEDNSMHPTQAGLLMFGNETEIVQVFPHYFLDYQERMDRSARWTDRFISSSGDWSGNLFDFYYRVFQTAAQSLKLPFMLDGIHRKEETPLHVGLREALANCLIHADYHGVRGIVIVRDPVRLTFSNPGTCRVDPETAKAGGISEPRNETLMKMFNFIDVGERAGSGIFNICQAWKNMGLKAPVLTESFSPDRMEMTLDLTDIEAVVAKLIPSLNPSLNDDPTVNPTVNPSLNDDPTVNPSLNDDPTVNPTVNPSLTPSLNGLDIPEQLRTVLAILKDNPKATYSSIAAILGKNRDTIRLYFQSLIQEYHLIERVGSRKTGYWKILHENFKNAGQ